jgi:hypothetical protein
MLLFQGIQYFAGLLCFCFKVFSISLIFWVRKRVVQGRSSSIASSFCTRTTVLPVWIVPGAKVAEGAWKPPELEI